MRKYILILLSVCFFAVPVFALEKSSVQKWIVFCFDETDGTIATGEAATITANVRIDGGAANPVDNTNPTELEGGYYVFDITAAESSGESILIAPVNSVADRQCKGEPSAVWTTPANHSDLSVDTDGRVDVIKVAGTTQTANDNGADINAILVDTAEIGVAGAGLTNINLPNQTMDITGSVTGNLIGDVTGNVDGTVAGVTPAATGAAMTLVADAITLSVFDETTAWPLVASDAGATQVARVGADGDTLETLSDQVDLQATLAINTEARLAELDAANLPTDIADIPTVAEFNARTIASGEYIVVTDTLARVTLTDTATDVTNQVSADMTAISGTAAVADSLELSAGTIVTGAAEAGTLSTTQMSTNLTEVTNDHYNGRIIIWTSGVLQNQATDITDYVGVNGVLTFTAVTEAPTAADTFIIL